MGAPFGNKNASGPHRGGGRSGGKKLSRPTTTSGRYGRAAKKGYSLRKKYAGTTTSVTRRGSVVKRTFYHNPPSISFGKHDYK